MMIYAARKTRWRQITFFGLALLGAWIAASGLTELVVSGTKLLARLSHTISAATADQLRAHADMAFLDASLALLAAGAGYLLFARRWTARHRSAASTCHQRASEGSEGNHPRREFTSEAPSSEPEG